MTIRPNITRVNEDHPGLLRTAILFRAMVPFEPEAIPDFSGMPVFIAAGRLAEILREDGADVDLR